MKKHMLKETNDMRRLMGLPLIKEQEEKSGDLDERWEAGGVPGVYDNEEQLDRYEKGEDSSMSMPTMDEQASQGNIGKVLKKGVKKVTKAMKDAYCQKEFGKDYEDCTDEQQEECDKHCGKLNEDSEGEESLPSMDEIKKCVSEGKSLKTVCEDYGCKEKDIKEMYDKCKSMNEDSEGEETYNYGEDEGADEHREDEMEDELHHDEEDMAPHDRIKAIEDHLEALKKDMGYDEDHEDRDEEGTHFAEGKKYSKVLNTLTESQYRTLKNYVNKGKKYSNILNTLTESEYRRLKRFIK